MKHLFSVLACSLCMLSCSESEKNTEKCDPSQPVVFTDFSPKEGSVRTRLYITGDNFGSDPSKIHVNVGGKEAKVIGVNGKEIYCMVPKRAYDGNITVKIEGDNGEAITDFTFEDEFTYNAKQTVGTLIRKVDENGNSSWIEGPFEKAAIASGDWMLMGHPKYGKKAYLGSWHDGLYMLDMETQTLSKLFSNMHSKMESFAFTSEGDTLLIPDDNGKGDGNERPTVYYALRSEGFRKQRVYCYGPCSYSCVSHPDDHTLFFTSWKEGGVWKKDGMYDVTSGKWVPKLCFKLSTLVQVDGSNMHLVIHPSGKYMYIVGERVSAILRSDYDLAKKEFTTPRVIAGHLSYSGYADGVGEAARLDAIFQGVFVKNREYEEANKEDIYDFFCTEKWNCCVRKVTPEGVVTTFAGRSNTTADGKHYGYVDGDLRKEARFNQPTGISYDDEVETFYVGEVENHSVRYITTE